MGYSPPDSVIVERIQRAFPSDELRERVRATNLVERQRKFDIVALFYTLAFGFAAGSDRSLQAFLERYVEMADCDELTYASFHDWFESGFVALLREILDADRTPKEVETLYRKRSAIETAFRTMRETRARTSTTDPAVRLLFILVSFLLRNLWVIVRWGVLATPRRGGRALPVWFRFEVFREWVDHALDDTLGRKWEAPTNGVGIPATYSELDAG